MLRKLIPGSSMFLPERHLAVGRCLCAGIVSAMKSWGLNGWSVKSLFCGVICLAVQSTVWANEEPTANGAQLYKLECAQCHSIEKNAPQSIGPNLHGIVGRAASFKQETSDANKQVGLSDALSKFADEGGVWDVETLDSFLKAPAELLPGTRMSYAGLHDASDRSVLIDWLAKPDSTELANLPSIAEGPLKEKVEQVLALGADADYGEYLAGECQTCHTNSANSGGVPPINGLPAEHFLKALLEYKDGTRTSQVMQSMSENLGDDELAALAAFFSSKKE